jgi:hypothetical protein
VSVVVRIRNDRIPEVSGHEVVRLWPQPPTTTSVPVGQWNRVPHLYTIVDNDARARRPSGEVWFRQPNLSASENAGRVSTTLERSGDLRKPLRVSVQGPGDSTTTVSFRPGQRTARVSVPVPRNPSTEDTTHTITLRSPWNWIGRNAGVLLVRNTDPSGIRTLRGNIATQGPLDITVASATLPGQRARYSGPFGFLASAQVDTAQAGKVGYQTTLNLVQSTVPALVEHTFAPLDPPPAPFHTFAITITRGADGTFRGEALSPSIAGLRATFVGRWSAGRLTGTLQLRPDADPVGLSQLVYTTFDTPALAIELA